MNLHRRLYKKLSRQNKPSLVIADVDGTIFTAGWQMVKAPFFNAQSSRLLHAKSIPLIVVTGRRTWHALSDLEMQFHGLFPPDAVICSAGTEIYFRNPYGKLERDTHWEKQLLKMQVTQQSKSQLLTSYWNVLELQHAINKSCLKFFENFRLRYENKFTIRITIVHTRIQYLQRFINEIKNNFVAGIRLEQSEKLLRKNTIEIFSGDIIIIPQNAGKDCAITYLLTQYVEHTNTNIHAYIFGDASIDVSMLTMKSRDPRYTLQQYGVHLTPLAEKKLHGLPRDRSTLTILPEEGPQAMLKILRKTFI